MNPISFDIDQGKPQEKWNAQPLCIVYCISLWVEQSNSDKKLEKNLNSSFYSYQVDLKCELTTRFMHLKCWALIFLRHELEDSV